MSEGIEIARRIEADVREHANELVEFWRTLVNIDSGSNDHAGVERVGDLMAGRLEAIGFEVERVRPDLSYAMHRVARRYRAGARAGSVALIGHLDTVWQEPIADRWPFAIEGNTATGPGVGDMKGCLVAAVAGLEALDRLGIAGPEHVTFILVGDEELGSPSGRGVVEDAVGESASWALCLEAMGPPGKVRTSGGGLGVYYVTTHGKTSHITTGEGISAVREMAEKIVAFENITNAERSLLVGVGVAKGGYAKQVVPDRAEMVLDLRAHTAELLLEGDRTIREVGTKTFLAGTTTDVKGGITRPVYPHLEGTRKLFEQARPLALGLGYPMFEEEWSAGGSDGNFSAALGIPTLDGNGPICHDGCSLQECVEVDTLFTSAALTGALLATIEPSSLK